MRRLLVLALVACAACSLVVSLDDLGSDGGSDVVSQDAGPDALDAADAHRESGPGCDAYTPAPTLCEDFDEPDAKQPSDLGVSNVNAGDQIAIDGVDYFSAPHSFYANVPFSSSQTGLANVEMFLAANPPTVIELALEMLVTDTTTAASGFSFYQPNGTNLTFVIQPTGAHLQEGQFTSGSPYNDHAPHTFDWTAGWVKIDLKVDKTAATETLTINGVVAESQALDARFVFAGPWSYALGFTYVPANAGPVSARIDNLAFWITP